MKDISLYIRRKEHVFIDSLMNRVKDCKIPHMGFGSEGWNTCRIHPGKKFQITEIHDSCIGPVFWNSIKTHRCGNRHCTVIKPQLAYYEMYGIEGLKAFLETVRYGRERGFIVVADAKRNDIGSTSQAYSAAFLGETALEDGKSEPVFDADAVTLNAYLGIDGVGPMLEDCKRYGKGTFILVKTSNPSSGQLQDMLVQDGRAVYEVMADLVKEWGKDLIGECGYSSIGAVVGATWPEQLKSLRARMPFTCFLVPGYGAQGGGAKDVAPAFDKNGLGAVINASRSLMCAYKLERWKGSFTIEEFDQACREEALRMKAELLSVL